MPSPPTRGPSFTRAVPNDWPELEHVEHPVAWFDGDGRLLRDNAAFRRRRAGRDDLGWILGAEPRRAVLDALQRVASATDDRSTVEMAAADDRWEMLTVHRVADRPGTVLVELQDVTRRRLEERRLAAQSAAVRAMVGDAAPPPRHGQVRTAVLHARWLEPALSTDAPVLILGEPGAGKAHAAVLIHALGERRTRPLLQVACAERSADAFARDVLGDGQPDGSSAVARARGGSVFLDGVDALPLAMQARVLRLVRDARVAVRWMATVTRSPGAPDLTLRSDLLEALRDAEVRVPPLRERLDEIPSLVRSLLVGLSGATASPAAMDVLARHRWPGNVRELSEVLGRAAERASDRGATVVEAADVAAALGAMPATFDADGSLAAQERAHIERVLSASGHSVGRAATALGISRSTLYAKLRRHGIARRTR